MSVPQNTRTFRSRDRKTIFSRSFFLAGAEGVEPSSTCFGDKLPSQRGSHPRFCMGTPSQTQAFDSRETRLGRSFWRKARESNPRTRRSGVFKTVCRSFPAHKKRCPRPCRTPSTGVERGNLTPVNRVAAGRLNTQPSRQGLSGQRGKVKGQRKRARRAARDALDLLLSPLSFSL